MTITITDLFLQHTTNLVAGGTAPRPTRIAIGTGVLAPEENPASRTTLVSQIFSTECTVTTDPFDARLILLYRTITEAQAHGIWRELGVLDSNNNLLVYHYNPIGHITKGNQAIILQCKVGIR